MTANNNLVCPLCNGSGYTAHDVECRVCNVTTYDDARDEYARWCEMTGKHDVTFARWLVMTNAWLEGLITRRYCHITALELGVLMAFHEESTALMEKGWCLPDFEAWLLDRYVQNRSVVNVIIEITNIEYNR